MADDFVRVSSVSDVKEGNVLAVRGPNNDEVMLAKCAGQIYAVNNICSHAEAWLDAGWLHPESLEIECPLHEGRFDLRNGKATRDPAEDPIKSYPVRIEGDDVFLGPPTLG